MHPNSSQQEEVDLCDIKGAVRLKEHSVDHILLAGFIDSQYLVPL